jgi:hypothetical protein
VKLPAAPSTLFDLPQNASGTEAFVAAAANQARAGDPLQENRNTQRDYRLNPMKPAKSNLTLGYGGN